MTINNQNSTVTYDGNGVTTLWPYDFIIPDDGSVRVGLFEISTNVLTTLSDTDYSMTGINDPNGGEVTYPLIGDPIAATHRLVIWREVEYTQDTELTNQTPYYPKVLETQLDRIVMQIQQLAAEASRAIKVTLGSNLTPDQFVADLQEGAAEAQQSADAAAASAQAAANIVATIDFPETPVALNYLRRNAGNTEYESRTPAEVVGDIPAVRYDEAMALDDTQKARVRTSIGAPSIPIAGWEVIDGVKVVAGVAAVQWIDLAPFRMLRLAGWARPATDNVTALLRVSADNGINWDFGASDYFSQYIQANSTNVSALAQTLTYFPASARPVGNVLPEGTNFQVNIQDFNVGRHTMFDSMFYTLDSGTSQFTGTVGGRRDAAAAHNALQFRFSSGDIAQGEFLLEGVRN